MVGAGLDDLVGEAFVLVATVLDAALLLPQFPKPDWHPVPQYAVVEPHHPALLQQLPNSLPRQVYLLVPPHVASCETVAARAPEKRPMARKESDFIVCKRMDTVEDERTQWTWATTA